MSQDDLLRHKSQFHKIPVLLPPGSADPVPQQCENVAPKSRSESDEGNGQGRVEAFQNENRVAFEKTFDDI
jgi:alpha-beta hydrolase superfamily lysophospholipase